VKNTDLGACRQDEHQTQTSYAHHILLPRDISPQLYASLKRKFRASKQPTYMKRHAHSGNAMKWKMDASGTFKASFSKCQKSH